MPFIIGTDEAGYGPNLGPLVVAATLWRVPDHVSDLYDALKSVICRAGDYSPKNDHGKIPVGDSKMLFQSRGSSAALATLERSVLAMLGVADRVPDSLFELFGQVANQSSLQLASETTYGWSAVTIPVNSNRDEVDTLSRRIREAQLETKVSCCKLTASLVFPAQFNLGLNRFGNKASLLSAVSCRLVRDLIDSIDAEGQQDVTILCDKHGGRSRYAALIQQEMTDSFVRVVHEAREASCYRWQESNRNIEANFLVRGERHMPIAMASMVAKYLRELSMNAWNHFWQNQMPALQPTAGYPQDARRFKKEISALQSQLNVDDCVIWREK